MLNYFSSNNPSSSPSSSDIPLIQQHEKGETAESTITSYLSSSHNPDLTASNNTTTTTIDISQLAPKKITWDLERDLEPAMKVLEQRTRDAIVLLLKERLKKESGIWRAVKDADINK
jgi:hypothetical protein